MSLIKPASPANDLPLCKLPSIILRQIIDLVGRTTETPLINLVMVEKDVYDRTVYGAETSGTKQGNASESSQLIMNNKAADERLSTIKSLQALHRLATPHHSFWLEIASSFIDKMEMYFNDVLRIAPETFHDIMNRKQIFARKGNKSLVQKNLDYAHHIASAFNLVNFESANLHQNIIALLNVKLNGDKNIDLLDHFDNQRKIVQEIRDFPSDFTRFLFNHANLYSLPPEIGDLENVTEIQVAFNNLTELPPEIGKLKKLVQITLSNNKLTALPDEIGDLENLKELFLDNNKLDSLPAEMSKLVKLKYLTLMLNKLSTLPAAIGDLAQLRELNLDRNQLTALPPEMVKLERLDELNLMSNKFNRNEAFRDLIDTLQNSREGCTIYE